MTNLYKILKSLYPDPEFFSNQCHTFDEIYTTPLIWHSFRQMRAGLGITIEVGSQGLPLLIKLNSEGNHIITINNAGRHYLANAIKEINFAFSTGDRTTPVHLKIWENIDLTDQLTCDRLDDIDSKLEILETINNNIINLTNAINQTNVLILAMRDCQDPDCKCQICKD